MYGLRKLPRYKIVYASIDVLTIFLCFLFSVYVHRTNQEQSIFEFFSLNPSLIYILSGLSLLFLVIFQYNGLYRINVVLNRSANFANIIKSQYYGALNIVLVSLLMKSYNIIDPRLIIFTYIVVSIPTLYLIRVELLRELFLRLKNNSFRRNVVIVGDGNSGKLLASKLIFENPIGIDIAGFVDDDKEIGDEVVSGKCVIGNLNQLHMVIHDYNIDEIIIAIDGKDYDQLLEVVDYCKSQNVMVRLTSELFDIVTRKVETEKYIDIPVIDVASQYNNRLTLG
ncbi:MAG TPA: hypothetical protein VLB50_11665, partial [Ignavibacteriaceae bacterium]|nr:hypothetical protein [Ignavibacteriaceae bacterium]